MGSRVHKAAGYGLSSFDATGFEEMFEEAYSLTREKYLAWIKLNRKAILNLSLSNVPKGQRRVGRQIQEMCLRFQEASLSEDSEKEFKLGKSFVRSSMTTDPSPMLFVPPQHVGDWVSYDRMPDYLEECEFHECADRLVLLKRGIYPYTRGEIPSTVAALLLWLGIPERWTELSEMLYIYWS